MWLYILNWCPDHRLILRGCSSKRKMFHIECESHMSGTRCICHFCHISNTRKLVTQIQRVSWHHIYSFSFHHQQHWHAVDLQEGAVLLLQLRPLQRRLLRSDRSFHHPQPYSSSPGHQPPMTRFRSSSEGRAGLVWQGQRGPDAANSIPQRPPQPTTLPSYCTQNKHHVPICHIPVDHFGLFIFQDVKTLLWKDYSYNLPFHQSENAHILKESKLNSSDFLYICGLWRGLNRRKRFPFNWFDLSPPIHFHPFSKSTLQQYLWFKRFSKELYFLSMSWLLFFSQMSGKRFSNQKWTEGFLVSHVLYFLSLLGRFVLLLQKKFGSQNSKRVTFQLILWPYFDKILNMVVGVKKQMVDILPRVCHTNILKFFPQYN